MLNSCKFGQFQRNWESSFYKLGIQNLVHRNVLVLDSSYAAFLNKKVKNCRHNNNFCCFIAKEKSPKIQG